MSESAEEIVCKGIKKGIFHGQVLPGAALREQELSAYFGVSRTPVRNALRRLAREGLVDIRPNRGAFVVRPDKKQVMESFSLRARMEKYTAELAAQRITDRELDEIDQLTKIEAEEYRRGDALQVISTGSEFHRRIAQASRHQLLERYVNELIDQTYVYFVFYDVVDPARPRSPEEHQRIAKSLCDHDPERAGRAMFEHLERQMETLDLSRGLPRLAPWAQGTSG